MTELKTLEDLDYFRSNKSAETFANEIKVEAIKWIKGFRDNEGGFPIIINHKYETNKCLINFIMHFFNIKKEDLE